MGLLNQLVGHGLNYGSHLAHQSGHKTASGAIDGLIRSSDSKSVRECVQDRRMERARGSTKVRLLIQDND